MNKEVAHVKQGDLLNQQLEKDQKQLGLEHFLKGQTSDDYILSSNDNSQQWVTGHLTRFPDSITNLFDDTDSIITFQGIFPEINCAWITRNNVLYLWECNDRGAVVTYGDQDQVICSVGLVKPKQGVLYEHDIDYVLVIATPLQITLLGVICNLSSTQEPDLPVNLVSTKFSTACDNTQMTSIHGTDNGRIFMCGSDGHLYELDYSGSRYLYGCSVISHSRPQPVFFLPRLPRIFSRTPAPSPGYKTLTIDNERCTLYGLTSKSTIDMYHLGPNKSELNIGSKGDDIIRSARSKCRGVGHEDSSLVIEYLYVIPQIESKTINLIAITTHGYRMYFTRLPPHNHLLLQHVRPPPPRLSSTHGPYPKISMSFYRFGALLASQDLGNSDKVYMVSSALIQPPTSQPSSSTERPLSSTTPGQSLMSTSTQPPSTEEEPLFTEIVFEIPPIGKVWAMAERTLTDMNKYPICDNGSQYSEPTRELLVLTDHGLARLKKPRPIDTLYHILLDAQENSAGEKCQAFFKQYGPIEACAMCLSIICASNPTLNPESYTIRKLAIEAYFVFGGDPSELPPPILPGNHLGRPVAPMGVKYSIKHDGLVLYLARLVSKVWRSKVFELLLNSASDPIAADLLETKGNLLKLKDFMDSIYHPYLSDLDDHGYPLLLAEKQSIKGCYDLLTRCIDALSLIDLVVLPNQESVLQCAPASLHNRMKTLTLESIVLSPDGVFLINEWVIAAIIKSGSSFIQPGYDAASRYLQEHCSSFYDGDHIFFYKGLEGLTCARMANKGYERTKALDESLKHFSSMVGNIPVDRFDSICLQYRQQGYYLGVLKLALERANKIDPHNQGLDYLEVYNPFNTSAHLHESPIRYDNSTRHYEERSHCYQHILQSFSEVKQLQRGQTVDGLQHFDHDPHTFAALFLSESTSSSDALFHYTLYHWLFKGCTEGENLDELLSIQTGYIIKYFEQYANELDGLEFLWQYSRRWNRHLESALYLESLAHKKSDQNVETQVIYIGLALVEVRIASTSSPNVVPEDLMVLSRRLNQHRDRIMGQG